MDTTGPFITFHLAPECHQFFTPPSYTPIVYGYDGNERSRRASKTPPVLGPAAGGSQCQLGSLSAALRRGGLRLFDRPVGGRDGAVAIGLDSEKRVPAHVDDAAGRIQNGKRGQGPPRPQTGSRP